MPRIDKHLKDTSGSRHSEIWEIAWLEAGDSWEHDFGGKPLRKLFVQNGPEPTRMEGTVSGRFAPNEARDCAGGQELKVGKLRFVCERKNPSGGAGVRVHAEAWSPAARTGVGVRITRTF